MIWKAPGRKDGLFSMANGGRWGSPLGGGGRLTASIWTSKIDHFDVR